MRDLWELKWARLPASCRSAIRSHCCRSRKKFSNTCCSCCLSSAAQQHWWRLSLQQSLCVMPSASPIELSSWRVLGRGHVVATLKHAIQLQPVCAVPPDTMLKDHGFIIKTPVDNKDWQFHFNGDKWIHNDKISHQKYTR